MHRNFRNVGKVVFGRGSFDQLGQVLQPVREAEAGPVVFLVDDWFQGRELVDRLPAGAADVVRFIDASHEEPKTEQVDELRDTILASRGLPSGVVGIGG